MATYKNEGFDPEEISALKDECLQEGKSFVIVEDDDLDTLDEGECVHIQFPGSYQGQEVIFDTLVYTLRLHHSSLVYEMAVEQVQKTFPEYVPPEERKSNYKIAPELEEEAETALTELIEEIEETETVKVQEHVEVDTQSDYGIALDVCLNVDEITDEVIEDFVSHFKANTLSLDKTLYSFTSEEDEN
ncbi:hypothetical protein EXU85_13970 [Spirosoma sp. KCTC 42546]|uniref:hypothetical protein n=1 Tax=Spirosoma sp. KCTC 42546 TaxID=2520506 RepID=UPI00115745E0|nr:hypothetical protein [Spirosoma sp. KCTC 42546]QDK79651.1 hypothetical protein EXU85_13970 [Spirosoma sp. KCTC 42546]